MKTVSDIIKSHINRSMIVHDGDFGVEIETETALPYTIPDMLFWKPHKDGSLRNFGMEYVLRNPLSFVDIPLALDEFHTKTKKLKFLDSVYCSVHVHINMQRRTPLELANFVTAYVLLENILTKYSGPERESNLFCLSVKDAEGCFINMQQVFEAFSNNKKVRNLMISEDAAKYSALNFATLSKIGSVEIRTFRGSTDVKEIQTWISIINKILEFSKNAANPQDIFNLAYNDVRGFVQTVFGEYATEFPYDLEPLVKPNLYYAAKLSTHVKDWNNFGQPKPKPITRKLYAAKLNEYSLGMYGVDYQNLNPAQRVIVEERFLVDVNARHEVFIMEEDV